MKATTGWPVALAALTCWGTAPAADLSIRLDARDIARRHVHAELTLAVKPGPLTLVYPKWIPGEHGPTGPIDTLVGMRISANGRQLSWRRDPREMYAITVTVPAGATQLQLSLDTGLPFESGAFTAGATNSAQLAVVSWNQYLLFPQGRDAARLSTQASLRAPPDWQLACALSLTPQADGSVQLEQTSLASLIDSPVQMGRYARQLQLAGSAPLPQLQHVIAMVADSPGSMDVPDDFAAGYGRLVAQAGVLFGSRMYRHYTWLLTLSDHVAHFGLEHHESSDDRVDENSLSDEPLRQHVAELLAHEYVHSWNGKYRRPAGLLSADYQTAMDGSLLWSYEGLTQYWGEVLPVRAGLMSPHEHAEMLAALAGQFDIQGGNRWRPLADTAVAAQILYDAPDAGSMSRRGVDFYEASVFLWLNVDTQLRARSGGRLSLDDYVRRFYAGPGGAPALKPYVEADIFATLASLVPADWRELIHRHLDSLGPSALLEALKGSGWQLSYSAQQNSYLESRQKRRKQLNRLWSIGLLVDEKDHTILDSVEDGAAARAGAGPGMKLLAVNGRKYSAEALDAAMRAAQSGKRPIELLLENGDYYSVVRVPYFDGPRWPHLTRIEGTADLLGETLKPR